MNYEETVLAIQTKHRFGKAYGRDVTAEMMQHLHHPEHGMQVIHIAGTNGKGSTAAFVSSILHAAGFCVGRFTSPHLVHFTERITVDDVEIGEEDVVRLGERVLSLPMQLEPTMFDLCLGIAILYFAERKCDYIVLETGLGGAKDSTAGLDLVPLVCAFTNIGLDHTSILGDTIEQIAKEKAGILKKGTEAVVGIMTPEARKVIEERVRALSISTRNVDNLLERISTTQIALNGDFQRENAALAIGIVETLFNQKCGYLEDKSTTEIEGWINEGLSHTRWPGRMEVLSENPFILVDGAHNPQGVEALFNSLIQLYPDEKFLFLCGVMADKDYMPMMRKMYPLAEKFVTVTVDYARSLAAEELAATICAEGQDAEAADSVKEGWTQIKTCALASGKRVIAFGSLYFVGELEELFMH